MRAKIYFILIFILSTCKLCFSATPATPFCWPPPCVPIDGGISLLIAAGAIYGGSKLHSKRKSKES